MILFTDLLDKTWGNNLPVIMTEQSILSPLGMCDGNAWVANGAEMVVMWGLAGV